MEKIIVEGGNKLSGEVNISLAKNSILPIIVASLLSEDDIIIQEAPMLEDVIVLTDLLVCYEYNWCSYYKIISCIISNIAYVNSCVVF